MIILSDRQNSFHLCLYALLGLGLCKSGPGVRRFSFGMIPEWYHAGGAFQFEHSLAIPPDGLRGAPVHCLIQPDGPVRDPTPQYRYDAIVLLWRSSQFAPAVLASRAPASDAGETVSL